MQADYPETPKDNKWIVGTGVFVNTWTNGRYKLPCLTEDCRILCALKYQFMSLAEEKWFQIVSASETWFINQNYFKYSGGDYPLLNFTPAKKENAIGEERMYSINIDDITSEGDYKNRGGYIETATNKSGKVQPLPIIRINQSPTLYIKLRLEHWVRELARRLIEKHSESELQSRYLDKNAWVKKDCPFNRIDSVWIRRSNLKQYPHDKRDFSELMLCGDLARAIYRITALALIEKRLECSEPRVFDDFEWFFRERADAWWSGESTCQLSEWEASHGVFGSRYHALELMFDNTVIFSSDSIDDLADKAWDFALLREAKDLDRDGTSNRVLLTKQEGFDYSMPPSRRMEMENMLQRLESGKDAIWENVADNHDFD